MTLNEAMAQYGPPWLGIWLMILLVGAFVLPFGLFIWRSTRWTAAFCLIAGLLGGLGVNWLYGQMGYVKLLGLPHIIFWTPLAVHLWTKMRSHAVEKAPRILIAVILTIILISLAFDYVDTIRYILGERTPLGPPPS